MIKASFSSFGLISLADSDSTTLAPHLTTPNSINPQPSKTFYNNVYVKVMQNTGMLFTFVTLLLLFVFSSIIGYSMRKMVGQD